MTSSVVEFSASSIIISLLINWQAQSGMHVRQSAQLVRLAIEATRHKRRPHRKRAGTRQGSSPFCWSYPEKESLTQGTERQLFFGWDKKTPRNWFIDIG
jgi:hypothetical protein